MTETKPKRRWFRFSLRTLFVLVTIISLPFGWIAYQLNWIQQRHDFFSHYQYNGMHMRAGSGYPPWSLRLFGESRQGYLLVPPKESRKHSGYSQKQRFIMHKTIGRTTARL